MVGPSVPQEFLKAENVGLRMLLEQASIDAKALLAQAGIEAEERETADRLQKLIVEELHHRIKNTLATVSAIASQSLRTATDLEHGQQAIEAGCWRWVAPMICCCRRNGRAPALPTSSRGRPSPMTAKATAGFRSRAPTSELCPAR
jgi:HWE histidine kinase